MRFADRVIGGVMGILGLVCLIEAHRLWRGWRGPGTMPLLVGGLYIFLFVMFLLFPSRDTKPIQWPRGRELFSVSYIGGCFAGWFIIMKWVGYPISTWIFLSVVAKYISPGRIWAILLWMGALTVASYIIFKGFLNMYLPTGFMGI
jgi:hypothetical protein